MAETTTIRIDNDVKEEATRIAKNLGLSFNMTVNILLQKFNEDKGFSFPLRLEDEKPRRIFDMTNDELITAAQQAVADRTADPHFDYTTTLDEASGQIIRKYEDGRTEYVIL